VKKGQHVEDETKQGIEEMNERIQKLENMFGAVVTSMEKLSDTMTNQTKGKMESEI